MDPKPKTALELTAENLRASIASRDASEDRTPEHDLSTDVERTRLAEIEKAIAAKKPAKPNS